jgi:hypothetical protein
VPNKTIKDENSGLLREAVEPHQIHEKWVGQDTLNLSLIW